MPALPLTPSTSKVLITGANGYVGAWTVKTLLDRGYNVRAVVRSESKVEELKALFPEEASDKLEFALVGDIVQEGAFDEAVKGVDGILHLASPLAKPSEHPDDIIQPAVNGTVGILKSAVKNGKSLKRIVLTSSVAAIIHPVSEPRHFTEADWNDASVVEVQEANKRIAAGEKVEVHPFNVYRASKTLAERAAWELYEKNKDSVHWDLTAVNPPFIYGPTLSPASLPSDLGGTQAIWYNTVISNDSPKTKEGLGTSTSNAWIDVRDVAEALVLSLEKEAAGNERIIVSADSYIWQEWIDLANKLLPEVAPNSKYALPKGFPELTKDKAVYPVRFDTAKERRILGIRFRTREETTRDILEDALKLGWL